MESRRVHHRGVPGHILTGRRRTGSVRSQLRDTEEISTVNIIRCVVTTVSINNKRKERIVS